MRGGFLRGSCLALLAGAGTLIATRAGADISAVGNVVPLDHIEQMTIIDGVAEFDEVNQNTAVSLTQYKAYGMRFGTGTLQSILPGVVEQGNASQPIRQDYQGYFPNMQGGGFQNLKPVIFAGVATFSQKVTQFGLTASTNGTQYLTAWDQQGKMIGQVTWKPSGTGAFVGIDTKGVPIAMIAYGNDDVWAGQKYEIGGSTIINDSWVWGSGACVGPTLTAQGGVTAISDKKQMAKLAGTAAFDEGPTTGNVPLAQYAGLGLTFKTGALSAALAGVSTAGTAVNPTYTTAGAFPAAIGAFPPPACGHGAAVKQRALAAGVAVLTNPVSEVGLTSSGDGVRYLTAWAADGSMIGQVKFEPNGGAGFVGLHSATPIKMVAFGDDDLFNGATYAPGADVFSDTWLWAGGCVQDADCANSNKCDGIEKCAAGICQPGVLGCDDSNFCTDDSCSTLTGCTYANNVAPCSDADACTGGDKCSGGMCVGQKLDCDDQNVCTDDSCDKMTGCVYANNAKPCSDEDACTENDTCAEGKCGGAMVSCEDMNGCTTDTCDPASGCKHANTVSACDDGDACTKNDACAAGMCVGQKLECDDKDTCTADKCDMLKGCAHDKIANCCHDDGDCAGGGTCVDERCEGGSIDGGPDGNAVDTGGGCGCSVPAHEARFGQWLSLGALALAWARIRRRRGNRAQRRSV
jgi:hypothetical protein